jgi:hypothetical protein
MAGLVPNSVRDQIMALFREQVCKKMGVAPFMHQREVWCAGDGLVLDGPSDTQEGLPVTVGNEIKLYKTLPRLGGRSHILADLGAFKIGKSFGVALWASGFAAVPGARVNLVGLEYDICEPEFSYLCEFLLSERGLGLKADSLQNRPRDGKMWMDLPNGARFEARSWERKDTLKGKEIDAYVYCEAYQLPGIECFTDFSQNLRARQGYAYFPTTPDKPWVKALHERGHGAEADWHCTCSVGAEVNPFTFDQKAKDRDISLMTKEKFAIHYEGKIGDFIGRVYPYQQGERVFSPESHPQLFPNGNFSVPKGWDVVCGSDTGTFYSSVIVAFDPDGYAFVIDELPNYTYVGQKPDRDPAISIPGWTANVVRRLHEYGGRAISWADPNSQFKGEVTNYGLTLMPQRIPVEARTEITREYFQHNRIWFAPWLRVLPFEIENAEWPEEASASGAYKRIKDRDHTLDCLEHILARRPFGRIMGKQQNISWAESQGWKKAKLAGNIHLGGQ